MKGVDIIPLETRMHDRGAEFFFPNEDSRTISVVKRKKGSVSGEHHHEGKNPSKDPEIIVLLEGSLEFYFKNRFGEELKKTFSEPTVFKIAPFVYHTAIALTDMVLLEFGSADEGGKDVVKGFPK